MRLLRVMALVLLGAAAAAAQCAMCYQNAASQDSRALAALNSGILLLLVPPVAIMAGIFFRAFRHRNPASTETPRILLPK